MRNVGRKQGRRKKSKVDIRARINAMRSERERRASGLPDLIADIFDGDAERFFVVENGQIRPADNVDLYGHNLGDRPGEPEDEESAAHDWRARAAETAPPWQTNPASVDAHWFRDPETGRTHRVDRLDPRSGRTLTLRAIADRLAWSFEMVRAWADDRFVGFGPRVVGLTEETFAELAKCLASCENNYEKSIVDALPQNRNRVRADDRSRVVVGHRYGRGTVVARIDRTDDARHTWWSCTCACGVTYAARGDHLLAGSVVSCGCRRSEAYREYRDREPHVIVPRDPVGVPRSDRGDTPGCAQRREDAYAIDAADSDDD